MKRKLVMLLTIVAVLAVGIGIWYNVPINLMDLEHDEVIEIVVFNGNTGNATHITDETQIEHIIENLNEIKLKRSKPSVGYSGYSFKMTIYLSDGNEADDWNNFIINSDDTIRKDPFFYKVVSEKIDYDYIAEASNPVPTPLLGHRCRSSQEITGSPTPFSTSNHYLWICPRASFSLSNPNIAA